MVVVLLAVGALAIGGGGFFAYNRFIANRPALPEPDEQLALDAPGDPDDSSDYDAVMAYDLPPADESEDLDEAEYERLKYDRTFDSVANDEEYGDLDDPDERNTR